MNEFVKQHTPGLEGEAGERLTIIIIVALFIMLFIFLRPRIGKVWSDLTTDGKGRYVALRLFKTVCYLLGIIQIVAATALNFLRDPGLAQFSTSIGVELMLTGLFGQAIKEGADFLNRKTRDGDGALAVPTEFVPPGVTPPPNMRQSTTPVPPSLIV